MELPFELNAEDVGWLAGPVNGSAGRDMPPFTGATSGPRDPELTSRASARRIMRSVQFSRSFKQQVIQLAREHQQQWSAERTVSDGVERSFRAADLEPAHVELWFALAVRVAKINPAIPAQKLWDAEHHCFDTAVATACSFLQWEWLNRHLSFGAARQIDADGDGSDGSGSGSGSGSDSDADGGAATPARDRYRSRRLVSDIGRAQAAKAFNPGQHLGFDDLIRVTRHREGRRVRHKAAVHTGRANDGLNDAQSHYFMWWEEQGWLREEESRDVRAAACAVDAAAAVSVARATAACLDKRCSTRVQQEADNGGDGAGSSGGGAGGDRGRGRGGRGGRGSASNRVTTADDGAGEAASDVSDDDRGEAGESDGFSTNSIVSRVQRACSVLRPHVGHCLWLDRGMANLAAMRWAAANGFYISAVMQANRIGLPRRYIASLKKAMTCTKACTHAHGSNTCKRWSWTVLHKGQWELELWCDGTELVIFLSNCTSATRMLTLSRSVGSQTRQPLCPGGIAQYNIYGRGPTDTGDGQRRKLALGVRRRQRQGPKGALFDAEIGFVNGRIVAERLRAARVTMWDFADEYSTEVLAAVSMRRESLADEPSRADTRAQRDAHCPVCYREEHSRAKRTGAPACKRAKRGRACCEATAGTCPAGEPVRPGYFCAGCKREREGCNGWYHWECYWKRHRAAYIN